MRNLFLFIVVFGACTKTKQKPSAVNGCVVCKTTYIVNGIATGWIPHDTTLCGISDSALSAFLQVGNVTYPSVAGQTEKLTTTCVNQ